MTATRASAALGACEALDSAVCRQYVVWLLGQGEDAAPEGAIGFEWALAHCDDGVTWGRNDAKWGWRLGNQVAPDVSPLIRPESLQELRLFGETREILIWRTDDGLQGRMLLDGDPASESEENSNPLRRSDESRILRGVHVVARRDHEFTHVCDRTGAEQVLPLVVTAEHLRAGQVRLAVRHYRESDVETGAVRIAATRLVTLTSGGMHDA